MRLTLALLSLLVLAVVAQATGYHRSRLVITSSPLVVTTPVRTVAFTAQAGGSCSYSASQSLSMTTVQPLARTATTTTEAVTAPQTKTVVTEMLPQIQTVVTEGYAPRRLAVVTESYTPQFLAVRNAVRHDAQVLNINVARVSRAHPVLNFVARPFVRHFRRDRVDVRVGNVRLDLRGY